MPFTPAHPAIVLPFVKRKYFSATGLIVGSISPDFEYFFKARVSSRYSHTIPGLFYFDLPVTFLVALIFHLLVKSSFIGNLPALMQQKFQLTRELDFKEFLKRNYLIFIFSGLMGATSHIFWDSFTHNGSYFVRTLSFYKGSFIPFQGVKYPLWYALQHISTFTGLVLVMIYIAYMPVDKSVKISTIRFYYWIAMVLLAGLFFAVRFALFTVRFDLGNAVVTSISSLLLATCIVSLFPFFKPVQVQV